MCTIVNMTYILMEATVERKADKMIVGIMIKEE
jgi:hypothetical protein